MKTTLKSFNYDRAKYHVLKQSGKLKTTVCGRFLLEMIKKDQLDTAKLKTLNTTLKTTNNFIGV